MMRTLQGGEVAERLFGRTRQAVLGLLYGHPEGEFYQQEVARSAGVSLSAVQRELENLTELGLVTRREDGRRVYYRANRASPLFPEVRGIVLKTVGLVGVLRKALEPVEERIEAAFVFGSLASGDAAAESDVDLMVVGRVGLREVAPLVAGVSGTLGREVNAVTVTPEEWSERLSRNDHFMSTVARGPKLFVVGGADELE
jgi:predicted nucleotidyltransferase